MTESILFLLFAICCMMMLLFLFYKYIAHKLSLMVFGITAMIVITILSIGCFYYEKSTLEYCPNCNFELSQVLTQKTNECPECHHSFEGMDYIKDICPFCGKKID